MAKEYIEREAAIEALCSNCYASGYPDLNTRMEKCQYKSGNYGGCQEYEDLIEIPAVDAVEVVRCKDCAFRANGRQYCLDLDRHTSDGFYCAYGIRREDGDEDG